MRTVQMTFDDELLAAVDQAVKRLNTTRSAFARKALQDALEHLEALELEEQHRRGYEKYPVNSEEFDAWGPEQVWGDE